ncbi:MAG: Ig domain-containing protein [Acidimicrobiales bacterium]
MFTISRGALPPGITLDSTTGLLSGFPTKAGRFNFVVRASNGLPAPVASPRLTIDVYVVFRASHLAIPTVSMHLAAGRSPPDRYRDQVVERLVASRRIAYEHSGRRLW